MEDIPPARASKALLSKLEALDPDVVMGGSIAYPSGAMAVYWAKHHQKPVIIFDDARPQDVPRNPLVNYIKRLIYRQVDAVLCPASPWTKGFIDWNFQPTQVFYGVDVVDNDFWETRESGEIPPDLPSPYLLAVGRQIAVKNFVHLLEVYEQYQKKVAPQDRLPLVLVGDGPERKIIEAFIRDKRLEQVFLIPFVSQKQLRILYHHAAALVLPSRSDTWGLVVNEAMAAGLPVLVSNACGCAPVLVHEGINGYTFPPDKPEELLAVLLSFAQMTAAEKAAMGMASRRIIRPWGLDQFVKGSLQAIDHAVANRKICRSIPARLVLRHWKGRYRPV
jgi:glycosyltransferase involved in cell wall biosynthesis